MFRGIGEDKTQRGKRECMIQVDERVSLRNKTKFARNKKTPFFFSELQFFGVHRN